MFIIKPKNNQDMAAALELLSNYSVLFETVHTGAQTIIVVQKEKVSGDLRLAEMAFQMNYVQEGVRLCDVCKLEIERTGNGNANCGHLTFTKPLIRWRNTPDMTWKNI